VLKTYYFYIFFNKFFIYIRKSKKFNKVFTNKYVISILFLSLVTSVGGAFYVNYGIAYTIPKYELEAAEWIKNNLPTNRYFFRSSSKNVLRYYAKSKALRMPVQTTTSNSLQDVLSVIDGERETFKDSNIYIYYAVTDPRNPYTNRPYESSFTKSRPNSSFPALSSHPEFFELIYHQPNQVYIWHIKSPAYE